MADDDKVEVDEELAAELGQAKKKPRNFAIITKGTKVAKLIVSRKPIKDGELQKAKTAAKGNGIVKGVCSGDGGELVFQVVGEDPGIRVAAFREFIQAATEMSVKLRFAVVGSLQEVDEGDDQAPAAPSGGTPPPAPPPPPPTEISAEGKAILARLTAIAPTIQTAVTNHPQRRNDVLGAVANVKKQVQANNLDAAKDAVKQLGGLLKELAAPPTSGSTSPVQPSPVSPSPEQSAPVQPAPVQPGPGPVQPTATPDSTPPDPAAERWAQEFGTLEPRYFEALKKAPSDLAGKMRAVFAYATEQAEAKQYNKALQGLTRLAPLIDQALAVQGPGGAASEINAGTVEKRKFLAFRWAAIPREISTDLKALKTAIKQQVPDENADDLVMAIEQALSEFYGEMKDAIDDSINQGDAGYKAAIAVIDSFRQKIRQDRLIQHVQQNKLQVKLGVESILLGALAEVEQHLAG